MSPARGPTTIRFCLCSIQPVEREFLEQRAVEGRRGSSLRACRRRLRPVARFSPSHGKNRGRTLVPIDEDRRTGVVCQIRGGGGWTTRKGQTDDRGDGLVQEIVVGARREPIGCRRCARG
jgi:hypothetical protein